ncbi:MAG: hypothetical protein EAZ18_13080 [Oscillatoriales cyanobacterium]|nr:MAG: hypothetical protein EAZ18_13080 [Oscillatoriales cyanobacterium]
MIPLQRHVQKFPVEIVTQQAPNKTYTIEVPARTPEQAVASTENGAARDAGYYDWLKISCGNETTERPPHRGGSRTD